MQDSSQPVPLLAYPHLMLYRDAADASRFYGFSSQPRLSRDEKGAPQINLMLYGRKAGGVLKLSGGQLTATCDIGLTPEEHAGVERLLLGRVTAPEWVEGRVRMDLGSGLSTGGSPSLVGANTCTVLAMLNPEQAEALRQGWSRGLPGASVRYEVTMRSSRTCTVEQNTRSAQDRGARHASAATRMAAQHTAAELTSMVVEGPLVRSAGELAGRVQTLAL